MQVKRCYYLLLWVELLCRKSIPFGYEMGRGREGEGEGAARMWQRRLCTHPPAFGHELTLHMQVGYLFLTVSGQVNTVCVGKGVILDKFI
jgi:hypothetical protein